MVKLIGICKHLELKHRPYRPRPALSVHYRAGFDAIAAHVTVILMPLALDLLLWLGPRLSMDRLMQPFLSYIQRFCSHRRAQGGGYP